jgi:hypothetical protein
LAACAILADPELGDHSCFPFDCDPASRSFTTDYVANGLRRGNKVVLLTEGLAPDDLQAVLAAQLPQVSRAVVDGQLQIRPCAEVQLAGGVFDPDRMIREFNGVVDECRRDGYTGLWVSVDMTWSLTDAPGVDLLPAFEASANAWFVGRPVAAVCQYDRRRFSTSVIEQACGAHPLTPGQAPIRFARGASADMMVVLGEADLTNREAFAAVLGSLADVDLDLTIDASALTFADAGAARLLADLAARRARTTRVRCAPAVERLLRIVEVDAVADIRAGDGHV